MLCEKCKQNTASVHMQQTINGETMEYHLCQECASHSEMPVSFDSFFQGFLDSFISLQPKNFQSNSSSTTETTCQTCCLSYSDFKKTGRLGCSNCYNTFRKSLDAILKSVQGSSIHQGKFPKKSGAEILNKRRIEDLKVMLNKAIENEEYEDAATLRDKIRYYERIDENE